MGNYAITLSVLFSFFLFSHARIPSNLPDSSVTQTFSVSTSPETDPKTTLLYLPNENPDASAANNPGSDTVAAIGFPVLMALGDGFRPINRHFLRPHDHRYFSFRFPHRCRHHHHHHHHEPRVQIPYGDDMISGVRRQIPYGNDMIGNDGLQIPMISKDTVQIPYGDDMIGNDGRKISYGDDMIGNDGRKIPSRVSVKVNDERLNEKEREESGFMKWFQEMVNRF